MCVPISTNCAVLEKRINMLTLSQVTAVNCPRANDDNNNTCLSPVALKALALPKPGPRRCLFGAPKAEDNVRIIREDDAANRARMLKCWSWDVAKDTCSSSGPWLWERLKPVTRTTSTPLARRSLAPAPEHRHHPYPALRSERPSAESPPVVGVSLPPLISPIPPTPVALRVRTTSTSSTSSTLSSSEDEDEVDSSDLSTLSPPSSSSDTWTSPRLTAQLACTLKVQTRLTDFWRRRRSSCSEGRHPKSAAIAIAKRGSNEVAACSV